MRKPNNSLSLIVKKHFLETIKHNEVPYVAKLLGEMPIGAQPNRAHFIIKQQQLI